MRGFASAYPHFSMLQADLAKLSWHHHITLLDKVKDKDIRQFYILKTIENGWTRDILQKN